MSELAIDVHDLRFAYGRAPAVLDIPELRLPRGARTFLFGPSGSGKTTFLGLISGVLPARTGRVDVLGRNLVEMRGPERDAFRAAHVGYVFQMFNLIPYLSVLENIQLPCRMNPERMGRLGGRGLDETARELAEHLEIDHVLNRDVNELSVGQQQRVAACRALIGAPELVVADEPTSSLDHDRREAFLELLFREVDRVGATLIFVSHDRSLADLFSTHLSLPEVNRAGRAA